MADDLYIDPATFDSAAAAVDSAHSDLQGAYDNFRAVMNNLGNFLGGDDAGRQLHADYDPAESDFTAAIGKVLGSDLPAFATSLRNDAQSWRNADTALFGD